MRHNTVTKMSEELKPCPFCGQPPELKEFKNECEYPIKIYCGNHDCRWYMGTHFETKDEAIGSWNHRPRESSLQEENKRLRAAGLSKSGWISVDDPPAYDEKVLVLHKGMRFCAKLQKIKRSISDDAPYDDKWFASPGWGHELKPTHWMPLQTKPDSQ
jgi:hypothetical protein